MDNEKNKGLADTQDGEFTLNESGTSVTIDLPEEEMEGENKPETDRNEAGETEPGDKKKD